MLIELTIGGVQYAGTVEPVTGPIPNPTPVPDPTPPVTPPPDNPGEVFLPSDITWSNPSTGIPLTTFQASGDLGRAIRFVADADLFGEGVKLAIDAGYGPGSYGKKEVVISDVPHRFTPLSVYYRTAGSGGLQRSLYFVRPGHDTPRPGDCALNAGQAYYINVRPLNPPRDVVVSVLLSLSGY